jgi:hypothetical protein
MSSSGEDAVRIPANVMALLRQSYDTREKILDWCLAIGVAVALAYTFRDQLRGMCGLDDPGVNAGREAEPQPSQDVAGAFPAGGTPNDAYTYNMPVSRAIRYSVEGGGTALPSNPSASPNFPGV